MNFSNYDFRYSDNLRAQDAINVTLFHWGIHGWIVYVVIGLNLGFVAYRWDLPMTIRTCFYPIIGKILVSHVKLKYKVKGTQTKRRLL